MASTSWLCVKAPTHRDAELRRSFNACHGTLTLDRLAYLASHPSALGHPLSAGRRFHAQAWFRDPPAPTSTNLSAGLAWSVCP